MSHPGDRAARGGRGRGRRRGVDESSSVKYGGGGVERGRRGGGGSCCYRGSISDLHQANRASFQAESSSESSGFGGLSIQSSVSASSSKFPPRPSLPGRLGRACKVTTNFFPIQLDSSLRYIYHYNVHIQPTIKSKMLNRIVMGELVNSYKQSCLANKLVAYDGQSSLYTAWPLPFTSKTFEVTTTNEGGAQSQFVVIIKVASEIDLQKLRELLAGTYDDSAQEAIQAFDVVLRQNPMFNFVPVKRSFHSSELSVKIGNGLEAWSGFFQSVRPTQIGLSLNIDISAAAFVQQLDIINFVGEILNVKELSKTRTLSDAERSKVKRALKGLTVESKHRGNIRRKYIISGLTKEPTKELSFPYGDKGMITVVGYFLKKYGLKMQYSSLPCLLVGNKETLLPMEVCKIGGGQRYTKKLNDKQTSNMVSLNNQKPRVREAKILEIVQNNDYLRDEYTMEFGIRISNSPASVQARVLPSPQLNYNDRSTSVRPKFGQWNMMNQKMFEGGIVSSWTCLNMAVTDTVAQQFCRELACCCNTYGLNFSPRPILPPYSGGPEQVEQHLQTLMMDTMSRMKGRVLDLLIVILPDNNGSLYGNVKRICETKLGLVSQCILGNTVRQILASTNLQMKSHSLANIILKINAKVGGINVALKDALPMVSDRPTIIFGADVTHPHPGEGETPSIAAVVASLNWPNVTCYIPELSAQKCRQEIIEDLRRMVKKLFHSFVENNSHQRPERIIFYRDGVSEGQFNDVLQFELEAIEKAWFDEFNNSVVPPITFVVVQKRHHTKLFPVHDSKSVDRSGNILPGTVVDSVICHPRHFDFYLCSHAGIQGTSRPAHYHVLRDDNNFTADQLHTLTNNLCYIFARCTRSVSYVSPAYYAHLAAFRARFYIGDNLPSEENSTRDATSQATVTPVKPLPLVCDNLKKLPFYC